MRSNNSVCTLSVFLLCSALALANPSSTTAQTTAVQDTAAAETSDSNSDSGDYVDTNAGASGSTGGNSFNLSNGGLIAIIVVVVLVVIIGGKNPLLVSSWNVQSLTSPVSAVSIVLFILAKRRQWNVRASISRASRRLTGRAPKNQAFSQSRDRRTGVYAGGARKVSPGVVAIKPPGHKRGLVVDVNDVEKGPLYSTASINDRPKETWTKKLWANGWK